MAAPLYTGKGFQAPQQQNLALQALGQFGQVEEARRTQSLQRAFKDRDTFAKALEVDPVYATSQAIQQKIAKSMDNFVDEMTLVSKQKSGNLSTEDLMKMQQARGRVMAEMGMYKAIDNEMVQAGQKVNSRPDLYDEELFNDAVQELQRTGMRPPTGFLFPAVKDPFVEYQKFKAPYESKYKDVQVETKTGTDTKDVSSTRQYVKPVEEDELQRMFQSNPMGRLHVQGSFNRLPEDVQMNYARRAQEMGVSPSTLWFKENAPKAYPPLQTSGQRVYRESSSAAGPRVLNGRLMIGNKDQGGIQKNVPTISGQEPEAYVFTRNAEITPVPVRSLELPEGVEIEGNMVLAKPTVATNGKTYWQVDKDALQKVRFTESAAEAYGKGFFDKNDKGEYIIKEKFKENVILPSKTSETASLIDAWTGGLFSKEVSSLPEKEKEPIDLMNLQ